MFLLTMKVLASPRSSWSPSYVVVVVVVLVVVVVVIVIVVVEGACQPKKQLVSKLRCGRRQVLPLRLESCSHHTVPKVDLIVI